jgi:hypothetical protein
LVSGTRISTKPRTWDRCISLIFSAQNSVSQDTRHQSEDAGSPALNIRTTQLELAELSLNFWRFETFRNQLGIEKVRAFFREIVKISFRQALIG